MSIRTIRGSFDFSWQDLAILVARYRDANGSYSSPSLEEELYSLADANFNVTAVTNSTGAVQERFTYFVE